VTRLIIGAIDMLNGHCFSIFIIYVYFFIIQFVIENCPDYRGIDYGLSNNSITIKEIVLLLRSPCYYLKIKG